MYSHPSVPTHFGLMQIISVDELACKLPKQQIHVQKDPETGVYDVSKVCVMHVKQAPQMSFVQTTDFKLETETITHDTKEIEDFPTLDGERLFFGTELALRLKEAPVSYHYYCDTPNHALTQDLIDRLVRGFSEERGRTPAYLVHVTQRSWAVVSPDGFQRVFCRHPLTGKLWGTVVVMRPNAIYKGELVGR